MKQEEKDKSSTPTRCTGTCMQGKIKCQGKAGHRGACFALSADGEHELKW